MKNLVKIILRGVGQVFLQNNYITGLIFLVGIFYNSIPMGLGAIFGTIVSTLSAKMFKFNREDINNGLYGYNGTLVGLAIVYFYGFNLISVITIIIGSMFSSIVLNFIKQKIPALTFPFVLSVWIVVLILGIFDISIISNYYSGGNNIINSVSLSLGQVMFQESAITGLIFFIGILVNSKKSFVFSFYGSLLAIVIAILFSLPVKDISMGLFSYNAVLCSIALSEDKIKSYILILFSVVLSIILYLIFKEFNILVLTAPFVLSVWVIKLFTNLNYYLKTKTV